MNVVYVAAKGMSYQGGYKILGIFYSKNDAIKKCLEQPTLMIKKEWIKEDGEEDMWTNGSTLFVKVIEQNVV